MARGEIFVQLAVDFPSDPKVRALARFGKTARLARDLYVQMLLYCRDLKTDGHVPAEQIGILVYPDPPASGAKQAQHLADVGLIERRDGGWYVLGYLKRNPSAAQVAAELDAKADAGVRGNHKRWHVGRGVRDPDCPMCSQGGSQVRSGERRGVRGDSDIGGSSVESPETETETETETEGGSSPTATHDRATASTPPPPRCPRHIDNPTSGPCGPCGDARKARNAWEAADAARRRDAPTCRTHRGQPAHNCALCRSEALAEA